jgi:hypothetical protein
MRRIWYCGRLNVLLSVSDFLRGRLLNKTFPKYLVNRRYDMFPVTGSITDSVPLPVSTLTLDGYLVNVYRNVCRSTFAIIFCIRNMLCFVSCFCRPVTMLRIIFLSVHLLLYLANVSDALDFVDNWIRLHQIRILSMASSACYTRLKFEA